MKQLSYIFFASLFLLVVLASFVATGYTQSFDSAALLWINSHANPAFNSFFLFITDLGGVIVVSSVTLLLLIYLLVKKSYAKTILISLGVGGAAATGYILKAIFERSRPDLWEWLIVETNFSFPSGHAIGCSALALCIVALMWRTKWRNVTIAGAVCYVTVVSISRLYLGVHYPSDILGGWLVSVMWVALLVAVLNMYQLDNYKKRII